MEKSKERKQVTLYLPVELIKRIDKVLDEKPYKANRTFFVTLAILEYLDRMENYGDQEINTLPQ